jgi:hypothetical protein
MHRFHRKRFTRILWGYFDRRCCRERVPARLSERLSERLPARLPERLF